MTADPQTKASGPGPHRSGPSVRFADTPVMVASGIALAAAAVAVLGGLGVGGEGRVVATATAVVCLALIAAAAFVKARDGYVPPHAYGLPGVPDGVPTVTPVTSRIHLSSVLAGGVVVVLLAVIGAPWWTSIPVTAAVGYVAWRRASRWIVGLWWVWRVRRALKAYAPRVAMAYAGRSGGPWQLKMWEPFILRSGERNIVINKHQKYLPMILEGADLSSPLIQLGSRGTADLGDIVVPSIRAMFYVQNARTNADFMTNRAITHVWLNHGDSDKPANFNARHAAYDVLVVCGQAGIDRYARHDIDIPREQFIVLGRPQSSGIGLASTAISDLAEKTVLYAPTWQGLNESVNFSSLEKGPEIVKALIARGAVVMFRPHPLSYRWRRRRAVISEIRRILKQDREVSHRVHRWGTQVDQEWTIADLANRCDALVSDVSSVVSDFLASSKPYAMTSMHDPVDVFRAENPVAETGYVILGDMSNLDEAIDHLLFDDPLARERDERRRYVLGDFTGEESADAFADFVRTLAEGR